MTKVELTKVHYYYYNDDKLDDNRRDEIITISRHIVNNNFNYKPIIKKNIFGHRWVLKINEVNNDVSKTKTTSTTTSTKKCNFKFIVYVSVFFCLILAIAFGIYFTLETHLVKSTKTDDNLKLDGNLTTLKNDNRTKLINDAQSNKYEELNSTDHGSISIITNEKHFCESCQIDEICLKDDTTTMSCVKIKDANDPTGCGGICKINTQHCKLLDRTYKLYECNDNKNILKCQFDQFNCGNMCINKSRRCDGVINCTNKSDEFNCPCDLTTHFQCGNKTSCLDKKRKCDGVIDCWDKSDEINCFTECQIGEVMCNNKQCIKSEDFCDGHYHCLDNTDEPIGCKR